MSLMRDPRYLQILLLGLYTLLGQFFLYFQVSLLQIGTTLFACMVLEWGFSYLKSGKLISPASAIITALGISLALRSTSVIPFLMASIVAIGLKHWLKYREKHIFNPSNSGIVAVSLLTPLAVATAPLQFGFYFDVLVTMSLAGAYLAYKVHRLPTVLAFLITFVIVLWLRHIIWPTSLNARFDSFMWGSLFVFTFNMITDPKTSPNRKSIQVLYGIMIGLMSQSLIQFEIHGAVYISLAVVCAVIALIRGIHHKRLLSRNVPSLP